MAHNSSLSSGALSSSVVNGSFTMPGQSSVSGPLTGFSRTVFTSLSTISSRSSASSTATSSVSSNTISTVTSTRTSSTSSKVATTTLASKASSSEVSASIVPMSGAVSSSPPKATTAKNNSPVLPLAPTTPIMPSSETSRAPAVTSSHVTSSPVASTKPASLALTTSAHAPALPSKPPAQPTPSPVSTTHPAPSTLTSVTVIKASTSAPRTSTVTKTVGTTLSSAVAITTTDEKGAKIITTPPLVTFLSTSTEAGGALTTVTNIVANPPSFGSTKSLTSNNGILHKQGVLAGICVVIGVVAATIIIGLVFFVRRSNRLRRRRRWLAGMQQQHRPSSLSGDPFRDPQDSFQAGPTMRSVATSHEDVHQWDHKSDGSHRLLMRQESLSHDQRNFFGGASIIPDAYPTLQVVNPTEGERYEYPHARLAYTTDPNIPMAPFKRHSMTPSTPSIYPATLPPDDNEYGHEAEDGIPEPPQKGQMSAVSTVPPRPPRSHLRESAKLGSYGPPLTPPDSSHSSSLPPSPVSVSDLNRPQDVFVRRTILDVRHR